MLLPYNFYSFLSFLLLLSPSSSHDLVINVGHRQDALAPPILKLNLLGALTLRPKEASLACRHVHEAVHEGTLALWSVSCRRRPNGHHFLSNRTDNRISRFDEDLPVTGA